VHRPDAPETAAGGRTAVAVSAQVPGQPAVAATATLPGAGAGGPASAQAAVDEAAATVAGELTADGGPTPAVAAIAIVEPDAPSAAPSFSAGVELSLEAFAELWPAVLESLQGASPMLAAVLEGARPAALADDGLTLAWPESSAFLKRKAEDPANRDLIAGAVRAVTGSSLRLAYELRSDADVASASSAAPALSEEQLVERFMREFDAELLPEEEP
jgi:DNA polymerase-3 subunit gamma/tau